MSALLVQVSDNIEKKADGDGFQSIRVSADVYKLIKAEKSRREGKDEKGVTQSKIIEEALAAVKASGIPSEYRHLVECFIRFLEADASDHLGHERNKTWVVDLLNAEFRK